MQIITARDAFKKGLKRYFTGKECKRGHIAQRMISNGCCTECMRIGRNANRKKNYERTKEWRTKNPGARTEEARRYRKKYPEKIKAISKRYRENNLEKVRERARLAKRRLRKINPEKEKERLKRFAERKERKRIKEAGREKPELCEICSENEYRIVFDHCHKSGNFRGWICDRCNRTLGIVKDDPVLLEKLKSYLEKNNG